MTTEWDDVVIHMLSSETVYVCVHLLLQDVTQRVYMFVNSHAFSL